MDSINYIPDPEIVSFGGKLDHATRSLAENLEPRQLIDLLEPHAIECFQMRIRDINAHEGTIWVADQARKNLIPVFNSGESAKEIVFEFKQPIHQGIISMVYATEMPFLEQDISGNSQHDKTLDRRLNFETQCMAVAPLYFASEIRGVISVVNFEQKEPEQTMPETEFDNHVLHTLQSSADILGQLIDRKLLDTALGR